MKDHDTKFDPMTLTLERAGNGGWVVHGCDNPRRQGLLVGAYCDLWNMLAGLEEMLTPDDVPDDVTEAETFNCGRGKP